jgi:hypothetical protein
MKVHQIHTLITFRKKSKFLNWLVKPLLWFFVFAFDELKNVFLH